MGPLKQKNAELRRALAKMESKFVDSVRTNKAEIRELRSMLDAVKRGAEKVSVSVLCCAVHRFWTP